MKNTIQTEIELLQNTKDELRTAIMEKGVTVSSNLFSTYPTRISQISMTPGDNDDLFKSLIDRSITSLVVPDGTECLKAHLFSGCANITSLTLPNSLKIIYNGALTGLHGVTTLTIPDSVKRIERSNGYPDTTTSLTTLTLGSGLEYIGNNAFYNRTNLTSITCLAETPPTLDTNTNAFDYTNNCPIYVPEESVQAYKTAWTKYADRIQAIYVPPRFMKVTNINDMTSGTYLLVEESFGIALNASLIKDTNSQSSGINDNTSNTESVTINNGVIAENQTTDNCKFEYDATNGKLKKSISTYYYLRPGVSSGTLQPYFNYLNKTNEYSGETEVTPMSTDNGFTFKSIYENKALGYDTTKTNRIRWYNSSSSIYFTNVALYKLVQ